MIGRQIKEIKDNRYRTQPNFKDLDKNTQQTKFIQEQHMIRDENTDQVYFDSIPHFLGSRQMTKEGQNYQLARHHLDDSQMKKILKRCQKCDQTSQNKNNRQLSSRIMKQEGKIIMVKSNEKGKFQYGNESSKVSRKGQKNKTRIKNQEASETQYWDTRKKAEKKKHKKNNSKSLKKIKQRSTKNIRTQCLIQNQKAKLPFFNKWNPDTDDEFSDLDF